MAEGKLNWLQLPYVLQTTDDTIRYYLYGREKDGRRTWPAIPVGVAIRWARLVNVSLDRLEAVEDPRRAMARELVDYAINEAHRKQKQKRRDGAKRAN